MVARIDAYESDDMVIEYDAARRVHVEECVAGDESRSARGHSG